MRFGYGEAENIPQNPPPQIPPQVQWAGEQNFPQIRVDELSEKCKKLVAEYEKLLKENQEILDNLETQEKRKKILSNHDFYLMEMEKVKLSIETYTNALNKLEEYAQMTYNALNSPIPE